MTKLIDIIKHQALRILLGLAMLGLFLLRVTKKHALRTLLSFAILGFFLLHATKTVEWEFIQAIENQAYDIRLELTTPNTLDPRIVIIDIDEKSLKEVGRWPWPRSELAKLINQLFDTYQIEVLGMDMVFAEPDDSSGLKKLEELAGGPLKQNSAFLDTLNKLKPTLDYDDLFAKSLKSHQVVLGYIFTTAQGGMQDIESGQLPPPTFSAADVKSSSFSLGYIQGNGFAANLPKFQNNAKATGHFNAVPDPDGIVRKAPMLYGYKNALYESLSLAVARIALGVPHVELGINREGGHSSLDYLRLGDRIIPVDPFIQTLVPYRGNWGNCFTYLSATDVLHNRIDNPNRLKHAIVLLGTTAQGLMDLRATPLQNIYPGVEIHANLISAMLDSRFMSHLPYENAAELLFILVIGLIMISLIPLFSPLVATAGTLGLSGVVIGLNLLLWEHQVVFPLAATLLAILSQFIFNMSYGYVVETRNKRYITNLFGQYIPPELVDEMSKNPGQQFSMEGESREMTVLFSDIRGFTTISEGLEPKELSDLMNEYLTPMTRIIHEHRGTIDKYMGDAIMAFWGAPLHDSHHARHAITVALQMLKHLKEMQPQLRARGWPEIKIGIGLNTGMMNVGNMGSQFRMAYTVLGDAVNLGSRLEGITKQYGVQLIVSETTQTAVPEYIYRELDRVRVKGKDQPVAIFEPVGPRDQVSRNDFEEIVNYEKALENYRHQHWEIAHEQFAQLQQEHPNRLLYKIYVERVKYFMENPPSENWDGVYTFTTK